MLRSVVIYSIFIIPTWFIIFFATNGMIVDFYYLFVSVLASIVTVTITYIGSKKDNINAFWFGIYSAFAHFIFITAITIVILISVFHSINSSDLKDVAARMFSISLVLVFVNTSLFYIFRKLKTL